MSIAIRSRDLRLRFELAAGVFTTAFRRTANMTRKPVARFAAMMAGDFVKSPYTSHNITPVQKTTSIGYDRSLPPCRRIFRTCGTNESVVSAAAAKPSPLIKEGETMLLQYSCGWRARRHSQYSDDHFSSTFKLRTTIDIRNALRVPHRSHLLAWLGILVSLGWVWSLSSRRRALRGGGICIQTQSSI